MKRILVEKVREALDRARDNGGLRGQDNPAGLTVERPRQAEHGDWSTNAAMVLSKAEKRPPREIAQILIQNLQDPEGYLEKIEIAGPGFINFTLSAGWWHTVLRDILEQGPHFGRVEVGQGRKVQVEFVSANPTGPLHVGHGRGAAVGDSLARVLEAAGYEVSREYYVNDAGRQMKILGRSVLYRYYELSGRQAVFEPELYQGGYIRDLAVELKQEQGDKYLNLPEGQAVEEIFPWAAGRILEGIRQDLEDFGIRYDLWFFERSLLERGLLEGTLADLKARDNLYEEGGALWFVTTRFGDDKDRVLTKANGDHTYFATDIAYHRDKFRRGLDLVVNLWGADHHGYVARMKSAVEALGYGRDQLQILLVQLVNLLRGGAPVAMSTRAGEFVTLRQVVDEVGRDAAKFIFLTRSSDSSLDFDLEVAKTQSADNPVYYVQYVHARICSVFKTAAEAGLAEVKAEEADLNLLAKAEELALMRHLAAFPDVVSGAAVCLEPHRLTHYLTELAKKFHPYYNQYRFVSQDAALSKARLALAAAVRIVVANGLTLLGVSAPEKM
ncbi:MAG: arginine--tRNA ligase [Pseudomonadota bacterium]